MGLACRGVIIAGDCQDQRNSQANDDEQEDDDGDQQPPILRMNLARRLELGLLVLMTASSASA